jgi:hypothetical protein
VVKDGLQFYVDPANPASWDPANPSNPMVRGAIVMDLSGNRNHLTLQTVNSEDPTFTNKGLGSYWSISQNGYFSSSNSFFNEVSYTICVFCSPSSGGSTNWLVSSTNTSFRSSNDVSSHFITSQNEVDVGINLPENKWKFLCQTYLLDGSGTQNYEMYYNGASISSGTNFFGPPSVSNSSILIGAFLNNNINFGNPYFTVSDFGPIMIYNRPLTEAEILKNYNHFRIRYR